jgi:hypothetical protein
MATEDLGVESVGTASQVIGGKVFANENYQERLRKYGEGGKIFNFMTMFEKDELSILRVISEKFGVVGSGDVKDFKLITNQDYELPMKFAVLATSEDNSTMVTSKVKMTNDNASALHTNHLMKIVAKENTSGATGIYMAATGATASTTFSSTNNLGEVTRVVKIDPEDTAGVGYTYVTIKRMYPIDSPAAAIVPITVNMELLIVGNVSIENGLNNPPINKNIEGDYNYIQTSRESFGVSSHVKSGIQTYLNMDPLNRGYLMAQNRLMRTVENSIIEGRRAVKKKGGLTEYHTGGLAEFIPPANYIDVGTTYGITTPDNMRALVSDISSRVGSTVSELCHFCTRDYMLKLDNAYENKVVWTKAEAESIRYELKVKEFLDHSSNTRHLFFPARVLDVLGYTNCSFVLNLTDKYQCFQIAEKEAFSEKTGLEPTAQYSDMREIYGMWGMIRRLPETHFFVHNLL